MFKRLLALAMAVTILSCQVVDTVKAVKFDEQFFASNQIYYYDARCSTETGKGLLTVSGKDNLEMILKFFMQKGLTLAQAAGIAGNMAQESGLDPTIIQGGGHAQPGYRPQAGVGFGLVQWTSGGRQQKLVDYVYGGGDSRGIGVDITDINAQLNFAWKELSEDYSNTLIALKATDDPVEAAVIVHDGYEKSADSKAKVIEVRGGNATKFHSTYADKEALTGSTAGQDSVSSLSNTTGASSTSGDIQKTIDETISDAKNKGVDMRIVVSGDVSASGGSSGQLPSASLIKLLVAAALSKNNIPLSSVIGDLTPMIRDSNNDAANRLIDKLGYKAINDAASSLGVDASIGRKMLESSNESDPNRISARGSDTLLGAIKQSENGNGPIGQDYANAIIDAMKAQTKNDKWGSSGIPMSKMAHKTGELNGAQHDVGYFFNDNKWLAVSILTNNQSGSAEPGVATVRSTVKKIYDAWLGNNSNPSKSKTDTANGACTSGEFSGGDLGETVKAYAWPEYIRPGSSTNSMPGFEGKTIKSTDMMEAYADAITKAKADGQYVGGIRLAGIDCGGAVTRILINSGFEPNYNYSGKVSGGAGYTVVQERWLRQNWDQISATDAGDRQPGDVAINDSHTYLYVGENVFASKIVSASLDERAPMQGHESVTDSSFRWYRKRVSAGGGEL
jgi:beta-lactamase class A